MSSVDRLISNEILQNFLSTLNEYAQKAKELYKRKLTDKEINASYKLLNSVETVVRRNDDEFIVTINLEDYWYYVENGRGPGKFPPIDKILEWIRVKPVIPYTDSRGRLPTEEQLAFLIARKIANEGTEGRKVLFETVDELNRHYLPLLQKALDDDFARFSYEIDTYIGSIRV
jgi:hypothetical protein